MSFEIRVPSRQLFALLVLAGPGCATLIGLPDLPDLSSAGGSSNAGSDGAPIGGANGSGTGGRMGDGATAGNAAAGRGGRASTGGSGSGEAGNPSVNAGRSGGPACGSACGGGATTVGGSTTGGTGGDSGSARAGSAGTGVSACNPLCTGTTTCQSGQCVCPDTQTLCSNTCADTQTDPEHCGNCTTTCADSCSAGRCYRTLVKRNGSTSDLVINATDIYFSSASDDKVYQVPRSGGAGTPVSQSSELSAYGMALDATNVYWTTSDSVRKMPLSGGQPVTLIAGGIEPDYLAVDATYVYFDDYPDSIYKIPIAGGSKVLVYSATETDPPANLFTDAQNLYWTTTAQGGSMYKLPSAGGSYQLLTTGATGVNNHAWAALTGSFIYILQFRSDQEEVARVSTSMNAGAATPIASLEGITMTADETGIYVGKNSDLKIVKMSADGTTIKTLVQETSQIYKLRVNGNDLFWTDQHGNIKQTSRIP